MGTGISKQILCCLWSVESVSWYHSFNTCIRLKQGLYSFTIKSIALSFFFSLMENRHPKPKGKPDNYRCYAFKVHLWEKIFTETLENKLDSNLFPEKYAGDVKWPEKCVFCRATMKTTQNSAVFNSVAHSLLSTCLMNFLIIYSTK